MLKSRGYPLTLEASLIKKKIDLEIDNMLLFISKAGDPSEIHPNEYTKAESHMTYHRHPGTIRILKENPATPARA